MKTKIDPHALKELKAKHRLETLMQEAGERFEIDPQNPARWRGTVTPGLTVDTRRQTYELKRPGFDTESGDAIAWLRKRYRWTFGQAVAFLQKRPPDSMQETPQPIKTKRLVSFQREDDEQKPLDRWQEKALEIAGERIREYFSWDWYHLAMYTDDIRIEPVHAPGVTHCARCEKRIDWHIEKIALRDEGGHYRVGQVGALPVLAYTIKRRVALPAELTEYTLAQLHDPEIGGELYALVAGESDDVICQTCAWDEYDFQLALNLVKISARERAEAEKRQRENAPPV